ncbi:hypothetical protein [Lentilactobacillus kisonensis]|uniref:hypothetical protein n=1 Tax=Lentilactobacillus kisonensis TaxID=481722 RepID=UPI0012E7E19E|nr:hypothetical protein [Lentilactobacillus kisonensis]
MSEGKKTWIVFLTGALSYFVLPVGFFGGIILGAIVYGLLTAIYGTEEKSK